jgi:phosphate-selective porin OprO/OprP
MQRSVFGDPWDGVLSYTAGIFNGVPDGASADVDINDDKDFAGRIFLLPFKRNSLTFLQGLGIGVAGTFGNQQGTSTAPNLPAYKTTGQQTFFSYRSDVIAHENHSRISPQTFYYWGPFGLLGEYVLSSQEVKRESTSRELEHEAWQIAISYVLTGEMASYRGVRPKRPFDPRAGTWGAFEVAARHSHLNLDDSTFPTFADPAKASKEAREWALGLNWYLNRNFKFQVNYAQTHFKGGSATGDREQEKVLLTRFQISY